MKIRGSSLRWEFHAETPEEQAMLDAAFREARNFWGKAKVIFGHGDGRGDGRERTGNIIWVYDLVPWNWWARLTRRFGVWSHNVTNRLRQQPPSTHGRQ